MKVESLRGFEVLDSRGRPTVYAECVLDDGTVGAASVPSGASTGRAEAVELRDGDPTRHAGLGCLEAASHISRELNAAAKGRSVDQVTFDTLMNETDGTPDKSRLGANAILGASLAFARAVSQHRRQPLFRYLADMAGTTPAMPRPMINLFSGGAHAGNQVAIQDVMVVLSRARMDEHLTDATAIYRSASQNLLERHGMRPLSADEGGLAPPVSASHVLIEEAIEAINETEVHLPGKVFLSLDVAASQFYTGTGYALDGESLTTDELVSRIAGWVDAYPLLSVEDGLAEEDWLGWQKLMEAVGSAVHVVGDDLLTTDPVRMRKAAESRACNALLLKVNQVGTLTEALEALHLAREEEWAVIASARSGETEDNWLADLATGWGADFVKIGSITQSDRLSKYNRLLLIERELL